MFKQKLASAIIVAGSMTVGWIIAWLTFDLDAPTPQPSTASASPEVAALERDLDELREVLREQAARPATVREIVREVEREGEAPALEPELAEIYERDPDTLNPEEYELWREAELIRQEQLFDSFDERLEEEGRDADWAPRAEANILDLSSEMRERGFETTDLRASECGAQTCRAEFGHGDAAEQRRFLEELVPPPGGEFVQTDVRIVSQPDGSLVTEAYFTRHDGLS